MSQRMETTMNSDFERKIEKITELDMLCDVCSYKTRGCNGMSINPNGPVFPPCADDNTYDYVDERLLEQIYTEILEDELFD